MNFILAYTYLEANACMVPAENVSMVQQQWEAARAHFVSRREEREKGERQSKREEGATSCLSTINSLVIHKTQNKTMEMHLNCSKMWFRNNPDIRIKEPHIGFPTQCLCWAGTSTCPCRHTDTESTYTVFIYHNRRRLPTGLMKTTIQQV